MSGREIEPLAFRVRPLPEECFESWLRRLAARHETTPKALFRHLGIDAALADRDLAVSPVRSEEHTSELQSLMRISYAVFCLKKKNKNGTMEGQSSCIYERHDILST